MTFAIRSFWVVCSFDDRVKWICRILSFYLLHFWGLGKALSRSTITLGSTIWRQSTFSTAWLLAPTIRSLVLLNALNGFEYLWGKKGHSFLFANSLGAFSCTLWDCTRAIRQSLRSPPINGLSILQYTSLQVCSQLSSSHTHVGHSAGEIELLRW